MAVKVLNKNRKIQNYRYLEGPFDFGPTITSSPQTLHLSRQHIYSLATFARLSSPPRPRRSPEDRVRETKRQKEIRLLEAAGPFRVGINAHVKIDTPRISGVV